MSLRAVSAKPAAGGSEQAAAAGPVADRHHAPSSRTPRRARRSRTRPRSSPRRRARAPLSKVIDARRRCRADPASLKSGATRASAVAYTSTGSAPGFSQSSASKSWIRVSRKIVHGGTAPGLARPGVAGQRAHQLHVADRTRRHGVVSGPEADVEPPVEADLEDRAGPVDGRQRAVRVGQAERHRLLAEHRLAGSRARHHQVGVGLRRRRDDHRVDVVVGDQRLGVGERPSTERPSEGLGRLGSRVGHRHQPSSWHMAGQELGVSGADAAGADDPDPEWARVDRHVPLLTTSTGTSL